MKYFVMSFLLITLMACSKSEKCEEKINEDCVCIEIYDPVCGCNDVTYGNSCHAACSGIEVVAQGPCQNDARPLLGKWKFLGYVSEGATLGNDKVTHNYEMYIIFDANKKLTGKSAINFMMGEYGISSGQKLTSIAHITTKIAGTVEALKYEQKFADRLSNTNRYSINDEYLSILMDNNPNSDIIDYEKTMIFKKE